MSRERAVHAQSKDYCAAASIDLGHDRAHLDKKLPVPLLLWGGHNPVNTNVDIVAIWEERALGVRGNGVPSGHWLQEETPAQLVEEVSAFMNELPHLPSCA